MVQLQVFLFLRIWNITRITVKVVYSHHCQLSFLYSGKSVWRNQNTVICFKVVLPMCLLIFIILRKVTWVAISVKTTKIERIKAHAFLHVHDILARYSMFFLKWHKRSLDISACRHPRTFYNMANWSPGNVFLYAVLVLNVCLSLHFQKNLMRRNAYLIRMTTKE